LKETGNALPSTLSITIEDFHRHKGNWLLWRNLGHYSDSGAWIPPASYTEAMRLPKRMLDVFFELDTWLDKMMKQKQNKSNG